jgi:(p)ppGpp synthase/HD superfamily hydrolase
MILDEKLSDKAYFFALRKHEGQKDDAGKDYFKSHVLHVLNILELVTQDERVLSAGILHDTIEDTDTTYEELQKEFGNVVADLVMEVTHDGKKDEHGYYFPRLHSKDGILIKFADRLSNLSRMEPWDIARQEQYLNKSKFWKSE